MKVFAALARVSRETAFRRVALVAAISFVSALLIACSSTPGPKGWTGARPVAVDNPDLVLAAFRDNLYAVDPDQTVPLWKFPADNLDNYPISEAAADALRGLIEDADADQAQKDSLLDLVDEVTVDGDNIGIFKDAVEASSLPDDSKSDITSFVDEVTDIEKGALDEVRAFYGDVAVSDDEATAYVPGYGGWLYALDVETSEMRWMVDVGAALVGGVAIDGETLYLGDDSGSLHAINAADGRRAEGFRGGSSFDVADEIWATPAVTDDSIYITTMGGELYRLDKQGEEIWKFDESNAAIAMRAVVDGDTVFVGAYDERFYAVNVEDGSLKWSFQANEWFWSAPVVEDDTVYTASLDGRVYALSTEDGSERWEEPFSAGAEVRGALTMGAQGIVVAGRDGFVHQVALESGEAVDQQPYQAGESIEADLTNDVDGTVYAVPTNPATLYIIDTSSNLAATFFQLPR